MAQEAILKRLRKLRPLISVSIMFSYYWWYPEQYPLLDEMVEEGYLNRHIFVEGKKEHSRWYQATEEGIEQYWDWVRTLWPDDEVEARGEQPSADDV